MAQHLLGAEALHLEFPTKVVFDSVTLGLNEGDRVGVVGRNGDGKTSLLAMLAGRLRPTRAGSACAAGSGSACSTRPTRWTARSPCPARSSATPRSMSGRATRGSGT